MTHFTNERWVPHSSPVAACPGLPWGLEWDTQHSTLNQRPLFPLSSGLPRRAVGGDDLSLVRRLAVNTSSAFPACPQALPPGRVPHVRGLSRTWVEHDLFPMLSPPVYNDLQEKKKESLPPDFQWSLVALANLMRLSLLKAAPAVMSGAAYRKSGPRNSANIRRPQP
jgi:hypothetical protein